MRSLEYKFILEHLKKNNLPVDKFKTFIETGTYLGATVFGNQRYFDNIFTVEINKKSYEKCKKKAKNKNINNINFYFGDSAIMLNKIITDAGVNKSKIYFLDGHVTDNNSGFTGKGIVDCPLLEELNQISQFDHGELLIIIDDIRLCGKGISEETAFADWSHINPYNIKSSMDNKRIKSYYLAKGEKNQVGDRIIVHLKPKTDKILCCIPARYQSLRLPGKPLLKINNKTIIGLVYEKAKKTNVDEIVVLTDDERIYNEVINFGGNCVMTDEALNGTERIVNYVKTINIENYKTVVNIQGDEPFIDPEYINIAIKNLYKKNLENKDIACSTICFKTKDEEEILSKNRGKVVVDKFNNIMYCSRNVIPTNKKENIIKDHYYNIHVGVFVYNIKHLINITSNTDNQLIEDIEWLKILEHGLKINTIFSDKMERGVDTMGDYKYLKNKYEK